MQIFYCEKCGTRMPLENFEDARLSTASKFCKNCAPAKPPPPVKAALSAAPLANLSTGRPRTIGKFKKPGEQTGLVAVLGAPAAVILILLVILFFRGGNTPPQQPIIPSEKSVPQLTQVPMPSPSPFPSPAPNPGSVQTPTPAVANSATIAEAKKEELSPREEFERRMKVEMAKRASAPADKSLIDFDAPRTAARIASDGGNAGAAAKIVDGAKGKVLEVAIQPGPEDYPGIFIKPEGATWDLSNFGHVEARCINTGTKKLDLNLRVANLGDWREGPWNCEQLSLEPGASGTVSVIFGYSYGRKLGYALKPGAISDILIFTGKATEPLSFRVESLVAGGPAGEKVYPLR